MSGGNSVFGRGRPERGSVLHVVVDGVALLSTAGASSEQELLAAVPVTRSGRRPRLPLGAELDVVWGWRDKVRSRRYRVADVVSGGTDGPSWRLVPLSASVEGTRRAVPRLDLELPVVLVVDTAAGAARMPGATVDVSVAGVRLAFPPAHAAEDGTLPAPGDAGELALLLGDVRVAVPVEVVRAQLRPDGGRDVRVVLSGPVDADRTALQDFVLAAAQKAVPVSAS